jgi:small subunit ribosomal protein S20
MANIASQKKRIARTARERQENLRFASAVKTQMKRLEKAVAAGDDSEADKEYSQLISRVDKAIQKGAMHKNTGARKKARAARVRAGEVSAQPGPKATPKAAAEPEAAEQAPEQDAAEGSDESESEASEPEDARKD